jgi:hypothetical protein
MSDEKQPAPEPESEQEGQEAVLAAERVLSLLLNAEEMLQDEQLCQRFTQLAEGCRSLLEACTVQVSISGGVAYPDKVPLGIRLVLLDHDNSSVGEADMSVLYGVRDGIATYDFEMKGLVPVATEDSAEVAEEESSEESEVDEAEDEEDEEVSEEPGKQRGRKKKDN